MAIAAEAEAAAGRIIEPIARYLAYFGGIILAALAVMTVVSVTGRALISIGLSPVKGDFELVEMGTGIAVFSFLPWCQLNRGHVTVDIVVQALSRRAQAIFTLIGDVLMSAIAFVIIWRLWLGFGDKFPYGSEALRNAFSMGPKPWSAETTWILGLPVWWGYFFSLFGAAFFLVVCLYSVWRSLNWLLDGKDALA